MPVSSTVSYFKSPAGEIGCVYVGGNNKQKLQGWGQWLAVTHTVGSGFEVRPAKRIADAKYELKVWGMTLKQIEKLAACDTTSYPRSSYPDSACTSTRAG